jgi:hypothetical protein
VLALAGLLAALAGCGGSDAGTSASTATMTSSSTAAAKPAPPEKLVTRVAQAGIPAPLSGEAAAPVPGGGVLVIGGVDAADVSTATITSVGPGARAVRPAGSLAEPLHDAAAARLGDATLVFGGGAATELDSVERIAAGGKATTIGTLPSARSDLSAVSAGGQAVVLGGYDGTSTVGDILSTRDGKAFRRVGSLPIPVRYGAVALTGSTVYVLGGELADGSDTDEVQAVNARTGAARVVARLPRSFSHASAVALGGRVYVLGGRVGGVNGKAVDQVLSFDPATNRIARAGRLPMPVTNATAAVSGGVGYLAGGLGASGTPLTSIVTARLVPAG